MKKSPARKKKSPERKKKDEDTLYDSLKKVATGMVVLLFVVVAAGLITHHFLGRDDGAAIRKKIPHIVKKGPEQKPVREKHKAAEVHRFEVYPEEELPKKPEVTLKPEGDKLPRVALIIDDMGLDRSIARKLVDLDAMMTFSVLPYGAHRRSIAGLAHKKGLEVMLHLPMEPLEYPKVDPGPGALLASMAPDELIASLDRDLSAVPYIKGVNNHMGSRLTASSSQLYQIFSILKKKELFFIDSRTSSRTLCRPSARLFKIPFAQRDVFLDHLQKRDFVEKQLAQLLRRAERHGEAIGIGHPYDVTYQVLREQMPDIRKRVKLVPASALVRVME